MSRDLEPQRDVEDELEIKLGIPGIVAGRWRRRWSARREALVDRTVEASGISEHDLGERIRDDEPFGDVFWTALDRAGHVADPQYIDVLGRLVAAALDPARVDDVAHLLSEIERLEPIHLRVLWMTFLYVADGQPVEDIGEAKVAAEHRAQTGEAVDHGAVAERLGVSQLAATRAIDRLKTEGFFEQGGIVNSSGWPTLVPTQWAAHALLLMFPRIEEVWMGGDTYVRR